MSKFSPLPCPGARASQRPQSGFTLIELMIAIAISLVLMLALAMVLHNVMRTNTEMTKTNSQIENGRFAIQVLQSDLEHAGFWGTYVPQFDDLTSPDIPVPAAGGGSLPDAVPDPCLAFASWTPAYRANLIGLPVQTVPSGNCADVVTNQQGSTDILVVRHAATCVAGSSATPGDCAAVDANNLYMQASLCSATAQLGSSAATIRLAPTSSSTDDTYNGPIRIISGTGSGQSRTIASYVGATKVAAISPPAWLTTPDASSNYTFDPVDFMFDTGGMLTLRKRDCATAATLAAATPADRRKFISNIYYIRNFAVSAGDNIPTLVRSKFDLVGGILAHQAPETLIEGIQGFRVEYGIDNISKTGSDAGAVAPDVDYGEAIVWNDPADPTTPTNRGDGNPDSYIRCSPAAGAASAAPPSTFPAPAVCSAADLTNVVAVKLYILARSRDATPGHNDTKTYALGTTTLGPFNDEFKRHVFSTTIRLTNVSGRRETPP